MSATPLHETNKISLRATGLFVLVSIALTACASNYSISKDSIGSAPDLDNPPKLIGKSSNPKESEWDRPSAFGPVPTNQQKNGEKICLQLGENIIPLGYNPKALDTNGKPIKDGGFLCAKK